MSGYSPMENYQLRLRCPCGRGCMVFDHNQDSVIDFEEIKRTMHFLGEAVTDAEVHEMIREADRDNDGKVDFEEPAECL
ncbi:EF hand [Opisthorchis viverrini]|uniref:EF hand n=1 Tax=Opisthorchis viverrini TaxID=6198 RepID=A0A1S8WRS7_OPIVI|nr:EF hand [Opisthorchis viverrini]